MAKFSARWSHWNPSFLRNRDYTEIRGSTKIQQRTRVYLCARVPVATSPISALPFLKRESIVFLLFKYCLPSRSNCFVSHFYQSVGWIPLNDSKLEERKKEKERESSFLQRSTWRINSFVWFFLFFFLSCFFSPSIKLKVENDWIEQKCQSVENNFN